ncbi:2-dehydro-3-deoxygalactonokinase [Sphingomonas sp. LT1P40]|uniref:2-dehydro-3-deoxygalactonokinase n=1 Tax=Alteristakelama amylovorans TaxID=3096166 RepID=UPI002FCC20C9
MNEELLIVGDWGSTAMRLHLCARDGDKVRVIDSAAGPGVKFCSDFEQAFFDSAAGWLAVHGTMPVVLAGMIGSNLGWADCPYATCPSDASALTDRLHRFTARGVEIAIAPGLRCTNIFGLPDVMRGEEVQLFGLLDLIDTPRERMLVCLPGTHAKWAIVQDGAVRSFFTSMQGELFEILLAHSLVGRGLPDASASVAIQPDTPAFRDGVARMLADPTLAVELAVFAARSRVVTGDLPAIEARAFLSGLLIAAEVRDAIAAHRARGMDFEAVTLVGAPALMPLYAAPIEALGLTARQVSAHDASIAGLAALATARSVARR